VALIAVVAIGVLFFVAWPLRAGEANTPTPTFTVTETKVTTAGATRNGNVETIVPTSATTGTTSQVLGGTRVATKLRWT